MGNTTDFLKKMLNPFPTEGFDTNLNLPTEALDLRKYQNKQLIRHAGRNLLGWGGALFAVRMAMGQADKLKQHKSDDKLKSHINARYPVVSLDPHTDDAGEEAAEREVGLEKMSASFSPIGESWKQVKNFVGMMGRKDRANLHLAATLAASYGGGVVGYKIADKLLDRRRGNELDSRISENQNEMDSLMHGEYMRTRGIDKTAACALTAVVIKSKKKKKAKKTQQEKEAGERPTAPSSSMWKAMGTAWWVWAVGSMALAYRLGKGYMDSTDPNRGRMDELEDVAKEQSKSRESPMLINESHFNPIQTKGALKPKKDKVKGKVDLPKTTKEDNPVDQRDPNAAALAGA